MNTLTSPEQSQLTERAFEIVVSRLKAFGNILSEPHRRALHGILEAMTQMACGSLQGRWAFGLAAGLGKSSCVVTWIAAMIELGFDGRLSIAVAAEEINALNNLRSALEGLNVDMSKVAMRHSRETTTAYENKPVLLVCHARVRMKYLKEFATINGDRPRSLLVWDESLIATYSLPYEASVLTKFAGGQRDSASMTRSFGPSGASAARTSQSGRRHIRRTEPARSHRINSGSHSVAADRRRDP